MNIRHQACLAVLACGTFSGCRTYRPEPLITQEIIDAVIAERSALVPPKGNAAVSFDQVATWMSDHNPELQQLRVELAQADARAELKTPLPNPSAEVGAARAFRLSPAAAGRTQPFVTLGFTIPLGQKRQMTDDLRVAEAALARTELVARHRELFLELRAAYARAGLAQERLAQHQQLVDDAAVMRAATLQLVRAGVGTGLDVGLADLEIGRLRMTCNSLEQDMAAAQAQLARLVGVDARRLQHLAAAKWFAAAAPAADTLLQLMAENHPGLARLKAQYAVAETALRLEIARQYPDLTIGSSAEQDPGERTRLLGLGASLDLPIFDRNEIGILEAEQRRQSLRGQHRRLVAEALSALDAAAARRALLIARGEILANELLPSAQRNLDTGREMLKAGTLDLLRYLELSRSTRELSLEKFELETEKVELLLTLESLVGAPLDNKESN